MHKHHDALKDAELKPLWHDPAIMPEPLPPIVKDESCELLIVGGGFTGLWAAMQAKERKPDADIILIEKTFVGDGASGRNGGFLSTSVAHGETNTEAQFPGEADKLDELGTQSMKEFLETLERYNIDAQYEHVGETDVALDPESAQRLYAEYLECKEAGEDVVWFDKDAIRAQANSPTFFAGLWHRDGQDGVIHPGRLCWGLKDVLVNQLGVRIFEGTEMLDVEPIGSDGMKVTCAGGAVISSKKVLLATNAYTSKISRIRNSVVPVWDYQIATQPLTDKQLDKINWGKPESRHALADYNNMFHYFRLTKDNRITWGGGGAVRYYFNRGIDAQLMDAPARHEQLAIEFFEMFPQLEGEIKFTHRWGGIIATSTRFCMVPGVMYDGRLAWAVGYTGHGVGASRFGARIGIELLGYEPSDVITMQFVTKRAIPWFPEPFRWLGVRFTQNALIKADQNGGKRGLWLKFLDMLGLGFTC
ncbi:NAD(P)/FAD-dependent oxidoreductase [Dasania marina]|uniref:NAD(P)/FAD-dependent oxidoreductase n=1 Tax=Dasania marina TaxID=471499 RepID=UPI00036A97EA|nr:FAD-dependent oxidoreductase [Dasania marina]